ncbi:glyoxalase [Alkalilimnicola ehrlichii]|uniref:Glyoxalase n=1 Tax=Alkalilimnicola ehrlichii TaxID=351052 RepID=A0A3E0WZV5_9GAMM|nr:VOC family protein [Alkalilimnicola ehrlichii]RFA30808.1 glyoxalase [Alkalilimnicola ehrlichii]RFA38384.1 glyoxalase [Alkalilimnicola ehrlichii]
MHKSRLGNIVIDCRTGDLLQEATFWSAALGCPLPKDAQASDTFIQLKTKPGDIQIIIQRVDHDPRAHLDIETDAIDEEVSRLEKLGAVPVSRHDGWTVMQAPSGHRFCVGEPYRGGFEQEANVWK